MSADIEHGPPRTGSAISLVAICLGFFMVMLDTTIVNVALPSIGTGLHGSRVLLQWVVAAYTLAFAALMLTAGAVSDAAGPRKVFAGGLAFFGLCSALCAAAPNGGALIALRTHPPLGITTTAVKGRRSLARGCVDWTARRPHLAGALGAALAQRMFQDGWITRPVAGQRAISLTTAGKAGIITAFAVPEGELADVPLSGASR
jgi:MFS family permease